MKNDKEVVASELRMGKREGEMITIEWARRAELFSDFFFLLVLHEAIALGMKEVVCCLSEDSHLTRERGLDLHCGEEWKSFSVFQLQSSSSRGGVESLHLKRVILVSSEAKQKVSNLGNDIVSFTFFTSPAEISSAKYISSSSSKTTQSLETQLKCVSFADRERIVAEISFHILLVYAGWMRTIFFFFLLCVFHEDLSNPGNLKLFNFDSANSNLIQLSCDPLFSRTFLPTFKVFFFVRQERELLRVAMKSQISICVFK